MTIKTQLLGALIIAVTAAGCTAPATYSHYPASSVDGTQLNQLNSNQHYLVDEPLGVQQSRGAAGRFNAQMIFLADQIERNANRRNQENTFLVTSFTNLNKLSETTAFGRLVAENVIHELQVRKWKVHEIRLNKDVVVNETGEFSLSRDIRKIQDTFKVGGIITGTYSVAGSHVIINARVIDIDTGLVSSSAQVLLPMNGFMDSLLYSDDVLRSMKIVGDTPPAPRDSHAAPPAKPEHTAAH